MGILVVWLPVLLFSSLWALILVSSPLLLCFVFDVVHTAAEAKSTAKTEAKTAFPNMGFKAKAVELRGKPCAGNLTTQAFSSRKNVIFELFWDAFGCFHALQKDMIPKRGSRNLLEAVLGAKLGPSWA